MTYRKSFFKVILKNYFENSYQSLASFFTSEQNLSLYELEEMKELIESEIERKSNR